jgi:pyrroloquinoline-quinone synthase
MKAKTQAVLDELDARIAARSILSHPFYRAWSAGELTRADLAIYARVYYPHVAGFPAHLESAAARAELPAVRAELLSNLHEERAVPAPHADLWLGFAAAVGCDPAAVAACAPEPAAERTVAEFRRLCGGSTGAALAALYAYESQQPEVSRRKEEGLREHYGVSDPEALGYFRVHAEADLRHRAGERQALAACLDAGEPTGEVLAAADAALTAYWGLLDGVSEQIAAAAP